MEQYATCTRCGRSIKEVYMIGGKPYGSECAERVSGAKFESWFTHGDVDKYIEDQKSKEMRIAAESAAYLRREQEARERTRIHFDTLYKMSSAFYRAKNQGNDWLMNFVYSIFEQMGLQVLFSSELMKYDTFEEMYGFWESHKEIGDVRYMYHEPSKSFDDLSPKQIALLERNGIL